MSNETLKSDMIELLIDSSKFLPGIAKLAKLKRIGHVGNGLYSDSYMNPAWLKKCNHDVLFRIELGNGEKDTYVHVSLKGFETRKIFNVQLKNRVYFETSMLHDGNFTYEIDKSLNPARILVASRDSFTLDDVNEFYPDTINAVNGNVHYSFKKHVLTNHSQRADYLVEKHEKTTIVDGKYHSSEHEKNVKYFYVYIEYTMTKHMTEKIDSVSVINSEGYKNLLKKYPIELVSTKTQLNKGTFVFAFPSSHVLSKNGSIDDKYLDYAYIMYSTGYIRVCYLNDDKKVAQAGSFDSSTMDGWNEGFEKLGKKFEKLVKDMRNDGDIVFMTPEEIEKHRGAITLHKYNI